MRQFGESSVEYKEGFFVCRCGKREIKAKNLDELKKKYDEISLEEEEESHLSGRFIIRTTPYVLRKLREISIEEGTSMNNLIIKWIIREVKKFNQEPDTD